MRKRRTVGGGDLDNFSAEDVFARIAVVGVGGSGCNAVNRMIDANIKGVEFVAINTDAQALYHNNAHIKLQVGQQTTQGLGAGSDPEIGKKAAEESRDAIFNVLKDKDMVFVTCGLGGGTGTGAAPVIAEVARELGALTIGIVTKPFSFEGMRRKKVAGDGMQILREKVDTLIAIPNDRLLQVIDKKTSLYDAFAVVDEVLSQGVQGIASLITHNGLINVDFADIKTIMKNAGSALMGIGTGDGDSRMLEAAKAAIDSPLLEQAIDGATGILFNVVGGDDMTMFEVDEAARIITDSADKNANIIFGATIDPAMSGTVKITVIATGFDESKPTAKARRGGFAMDEEDEKSEPAVAKKSNDDNDLEVPAFIRKKIKR